MAGASGPHAAMRADADKCGAVPPMVDRQGRSYGDHSPLQETDMSSILPFWIIVAPAILVLIDSFTASNTTVPGTLQAAPGSSAATRR